MDKLLNYKGYVIVLDGIVGKIYPSNRLYVEYIYKTRLIGYTQTEALRLLKSVINTMINESRTINTYA